MKLQPLDFEKPIAELEQKLEDRLRHSRDHNVNIEPEGKRMEAKIEETKRAVYSTLTPWQRVQIARHTARPFTLDYLQLSFHNFVELHGDRRYAEDPSMPGGLATIGQHKCVVIGHQKGRDTRSEAKIEETKRAVYSTLTPWQRVQIARHTARPFTLDYLQLSFHNFVELHGDRRYAEDPSMPGGLATIGQHKCVVIGHQKGRDT